MTTTVPGKEDVFNRIIDGAKHYRPGYEGMTPQLAESWSEGCGFGIVSHCGFMSFRDSDNPFALSRIRKERKSWKELQAMARKEHQQNPLL